jgi:glycosyltransferase involved in cell wall biosynthesis
MKLLLLTPMPPDRTAPLAIQALLHMQLRGLATHHEVTVVTVAGPDEQELAAVERLVDEGFEVYAAQRVAPVGVGRWSRRGRLVATWLRRSWPWRTVWFWEPGLQKVVDQLVGEKRFDVVAVEDSAMGVYRIPASVPRVFTEHEVRDDVRAPAALDGARGIPTWFARQVNWRRWGAYQLGVWRSFDVIQAYTDRDAVSIRRQLDGSGPPVRVNPFGIDLPPRIEAPEDPDLIVFVGNYTHAPNADAALWLGQEILPQLRRFRPSARLELAGAYPPPSVRRLEGPNLRVLGRVADVEELMRRAALVFAPVRTGGGMRMKTLHAMALGKAVVTTPLGIEGLAVGGRVPPVAVGKQAASLALSAAGLLQDVASRRRMGDEARAFVERHHSPEAYAARLSDTYRFAVEMRTRGRTTCR